LSDHLWQLREFAERLGWRGLCVHRTTLPPAIARTPAETITFYSTPDSKFFLQINEHPPGQSAHFQATVLAERYAIGVIGWLPFSITSAESPEVEAERLAPQLSRRLFRDVTWRRRFLLENPSLVLPDRMGRRRYQRFVRECAIRRQP
jgi:hypothetical protein